MTTTDVWTYRETIVGTGAGSTDVVGFGVEAIDGSIGKVDEATYDAAMMKEHLDRTTDEVVARVNGNWTGDVAAYDQVHEQALEMADMLSDGIIANFPSKFRP